MKLKVVAYMQPGCFGSVVWIICMLLFVLISCELAHVSSWNIIFHSLPISVYTSTVDLAFDDKIHRTRRHHAAHELHPFDVQSGDTFILYNF
jgi:hypothetical protein